MPVPKPVDRQAPSTGYLIWHLSLRWRAALDRGLDPLGITSGQYALLASLHAMSTTGHRPSQRQLADFIGLEPMHVSKLVRALQRAGLVERAVNPADPRAIQVDITAAGASAVAAGRRVVRKLENERLAPLGGRTSPRSVEFREMLLALLRHNPDGGASPAG